MLEAQVLDQETQVGVQRVELLQLLVLGKGLNLQLSCLHFLRCDFFFQLLDAVIEYELEFLKLLGLLFKLENLGFTVSNLLIFLRNVIVKQLNVILVLLEMHFLLLNGSCLVSDIPHKTVHIRRNVLHLALNQLQLGLRLKGHVLHLVLVLVVLEADLVDFFVPVLLDLFNCLLVSLD